MRPFVRCVIAVLLCLGAGQACQRAVFAQSVDEKKAMVLVTWFGPGGITLPVGKGLKPEMLTAYDNGRRPVAQFSKDDGSLTVSFILFENLSGDPTGKGCRSDAIDPIVAKDGKLISKRVDGETKTDAGVVDTTAYQMDMSPSAPGHFLHNLFGFAGNAKTCAEIHVSTTRETPVPEQAMKGLLAQFRFDLDYKPESLDYFRMATILFPTSPGVSAPYYKSSLDTMPKDASFTNPRRVATDQLVMALGMSGDVKSSRAVAEAATKSDPDYPINYYNLACADAEQGDAAQAKVHLQQAFERRANLLTGDSMPDPTKDDSILKLKNDKAFWDWLQTLPKG